MQWDAGLGVWMQNLQDIFGFKLLALLFVVQHCVKGFGHGLVQQADPYLYRSYNVPAPEMQIFTTVAMIPWAMKPAMGLASDILPIGGFNKAPYVLMAAVLGVVACLVIGLIPHDMLNIRLVVVCMMMFQLLASTGDLLSEAKYASRIQERPAHGPKILSYVWFGLQAGGLVAVSCSGALISWFGPKILYLVVSIPVAAVILPTMLNYFEEHQQSAEEIQATRERFYKQKEACFLCGIMLLGTITLSACGLIFNDVVVNATVASVLALVVVISFGVLLKPVIAKFSVFSMIQGSLMLSIRGATFYFYTDTPEQYPEGPHFSPFFYNTVMGVVGAVCSLVGIVCYQRFMSAWKYRNLLIAVNVGLSLLSLLDIVMFTRLNVRLGIPDHAFVLGSSALEQVVSQWAWMPQVVIISYLCPEGMEATMYALLAGSSNLGSAVASNIGALLLQRLGCTPSGSPNESATFEHLWVGSAISSALPLLVILALFWLIPDARQNERLLVDDRSDATAGSLWRRWTEDGSRD